MAEPVDEYAVHQLNKFDGTRPKPTTKERLDLGDQDEKKTLEELKIEPKSLRKLMKEALGDKVEVAIVNDRIVDSLCVLTMSEHGLSANMERIAHQPSGSQQHRSTQQRNQAMQGREGKKEEKGEKGEKKETREENKRKTGRQVEKEKGRKGERGKKEEGREAEGEEVTQVKKDVTDWTVVLRHRRQKKMIQIFVKVNESKAFPLEVSTDDKVEGVMKHFQVDEDAYVTLHGRVLKRSEKLKSCEVTDGCMVHAAHAEHSLQPTGPVGPTHSRW